VSDEGRYGIAELAERGGVSRRTVRYYVQRGLLPPPTGVGRGKHYTEAHLEALVRVRELQESGVALAEIPAHGEDGGGVGDSPPAAPKEQSTWTRVVLGEGLELHVRGRRLSETQVRALEAAVHGALGEEER